MLEEILYEADLGSSVVDHFIENISSFAKKNPNTSKDQYLDQLEKIALEIFTHATPPQEKETTTSPKVILMVGVA